MPVGSQTKANKPPHLSEKGFVAFLQRNSASFLARLIYIGYYLLEHRRYGGFHHDFGPVKVLQDAYGELFSRGLKNKEDTSDPEVQVY